MSERYYITGCQLAMLRMLKDTNRILNEIEVNQFIGNINQKHRKIVIL